VSGEGAGAGDAATAEGEGIDAVAARTAQQAAARPGGLGLRVVVMGVSGSGKTTEGEHIAERLGEPFVDADSLHPEANVAKMSAGIPLTDHDRWPWLDIVGRTLADAGPGGVVMACSALRRAYRDRIRAVAPDTVFVHLSAPFDVLARRMEHRTHFFPESLLASQFATLEPLGADENGVVIDVDAPVSVVVDRAVAALEAHPAARAVK
jgi:beta-N-acetylhexosaminidase